ncbi:MAG: cell division protein SepF [Oscillospiraceae bacterium]|nr:cell division protein SepF [Oscillospiraceae bacterium]
MALSDVLRRFRFRDYDEVYEEEDGSAIMETRYDDYESAPKSGGKVMSLHEKNSFNLKLHKFKGHQYQETAKKAANDFKAGNSVLLNTEEANKDATTRLLDFLGGVVYALDGKMVRFSSTGYAIVPYNCEITGDIYEDLSYQIDDMFN